MRVDLVGTLSCSCLWQPLNYNYPCSLALSSEDIIVMVSSEELVDSLNRLFSYSGGFILEVSR